MAERIQASFDSQRRFVSNAAHELKTPLSSMKVAVTAALENNKSNEEYQELVQFVAQRIKTQELLIAELLFLAQSDEKRLASQFNIMNISEIICEFKETFAYVFEEKNIDLKECITDEIFIRGDRKLISQLIMNLLDNALAYTPKGGVVIISLTRDKNWAILTVKDNGRGIPEDSLDKVFERFYKVPNETPANSGFGLGLSICKSIVQTLGGNIRVNSNLNLGTIFTVLLPLVEHDKHKK
jgi:signal transduction histidine kinase